MRVIRTFGKIFMILIALLEAFAAGVITGWVCLVEVTNESHEKSSKRDYES